jgi:hydroxyacylglutathione hydrolase
VLEDPTSYAPPGLPLRACTPDVLLEGGETLELAGVTFDVVPVPGHSPAHLAYAIDGAVLSGDVLFAGSVGRTDLPGADWQTLLDSIKALVDRLPAETAVYPGHGPATTLGAEFASNQFLAELRLGSPDPTG